MANANLSLVFDIVARDRASKEFDRVGDAAGRAGHAGGQFGKALSAIGLAGGGLAAVGLGKAFAGFIEGAQSGARIGRISQQIISQTGQAAGVTADHVADLADAIERKTGADGDAIQSGANVLLTFTNVRNEVGKGNDVFDQTVGIAQDMATVLGGDASSAATQLGKALNDPIKGITALSKAGVSFTEQQKDQIKTLVQSGDQLGAQKVILGELSKEFGGAAEAAATPFDRLKAKVGQFGEELVSGLLPVIDKSVNFLDRNSDSIGALASAVGSAAGQVVAMASAGAALVSFLNENREATIVLTSAIVGGLLPALSVMAADFALATAAKLSVFFQDAVAGIRAFIAAEGALTISTAAATAGLSLLAAGAAVLFLKARSDTKKFQQSLEDLRNTDPLDTGKVGQARDSLQGIINKLKDVPIASKELKSAQADLDALNTSVQSAQDRVAGLASEYHVSADAIVKFAEAAHVDLGSSSFDAASLSVGRYIDTTIKGKTPAENLAAATQVLGDKAATASEKADALKNSIEAAFGVQISAEEATSKYEAALDDLTDSITENGKTLDIGTAKGRANRQSVVDIGTSLADLISAQRDAGKSQEVLGRTFDQGYAKFQATAAAAGITGQAFDDLAAAVGLVPSAKEILIGQKGADEAIAAIKGVKSLLDTLKDKTINLKVVQRSEDTRGPRAGFNQLDGARALGGPVSAGRTYLVGEQGRELFVPDQPGTIMTAARTAGFLAAGAGGRPPQVNVYIGDEQLTSRVDYRVDHALGNLATAAYYGGAR